MQYEYLKKSVKMTIDEIKELKYIYLTNIPKASILKYKIKNINYYLSNYTISIEIEGACKVVLKNKNRDNIFYEPMKNNTHITKMDAVRRLIWHYKFNSSIIDNEEMKQELLLKYPESWF